VLTVRDEGVGMDTATCERAFEAFFSTKEEGRGTGLGLVTVRAAAVTSGGTVRIRSAPGEGSTFEVVFPLADARTSRERTSAVPTSPPRVLLVDDDAAVRRALAEAVRARRRGRPIRQRLLAPQNSKPKGRARKVLAPVSTSISMTAPPQLKP
jgi:hypothetical protein